MGLGEENFSVSTGVIPGIGIKIWKHRETLSLEVRFERRGLSYEFVRWWRRRWSPGFAAFYSHVRDSLPSPDSASAEKTPGTPTDVAVSINPIIILSPIFKPKKTPARNPKRKGNQWMASKQEDRPHQVSKLDLEGSC